MTQATKSYLQNKPWLQNWKSAWNKILALLMTALLIFIAAGLPVFAEGASSEVSLGLNKTTLNIGKTFLLSFKIKPNASLQIRSFDAKIHYDSSKFEIQTGADGPKITKASNVPATFKIDANAAGNEIAVLGIDDTSSQNAPIKINSETAVVSFTFTVKDNAAIGNASFSITECNIESTTQTVPLTIAAAKTVPVAARLETNAALSELKTDIGTLSPVFSKTVLAYKMEVPMDTTVVNVTAKAESALAKVTVTGGKALSFGDNKITIAVTAQDTDVVKSYVITVRRPSPYMSSSEESSLSESSVSEDSSEWISSEAVSMESSSMASSSDPSSAATSAELKFWKILAYIFMGLFLLTAGAVIWLVSVRLSERDKVVKIRRI